MRLYDWISRDAEAVKCPKCGGFADKVGCTKDEIAGDMNCGRSFACCVAAFVCGLCGERIVARREAPEME